jgi:quinohemoprotein ethanol dehydrogenase
LWKDTVIIAANCRLIAVDQKTGKMRWGAQSCDPTQMYGISGAPRVGEGLVFTGNLCGDSGMTRGYVDAFDADTGAHRWRFYTVPGDPTKQQDSPLYETAAKTWGSDWYSKTHGCGSVWDAITYDQKLHQLYVGVGGPAPFAPTARASDAGDELFTNSVVALDARTGAYRWHFKEVPHDGWNYEPSVGIMVAELPTGSGARRVVLSVPKNGFAYVLDAKTGKFLSGDPYVTLNWAKGLDADGRPIPDSAAMYWTSGSAHIVLPGGLGAHGWEALAFDPKSNLVFIPTMVMPMKITLDPTQGIGAVAVDYYFGSSESSRWRSHGEVVAWDPVGRQVKWRAQAKLPMNGGLLHTAGGLVFQGQADGKLVALDATNGEELWSHQTGGAIRAAPSTVMVDGHQYIFVATGNGAAAGTAYVSKYNSTPAVRTPPRLLAFRLGGANAYPPLAAVLQTPKPTLSRQDATLAAQGKQLYESTCEACHGVDGSSVGGQVPNLTRMLPQTFEAFQRIVQQGALASQGMPQMSEMSDKDAHAVYSYLVNQAWDAFDGDATAGRSH